jgi:hypothetical protein
MSFINPIDALELKSVDVSSINPEVIKKAKRRLQAEIDLSEKGFIDSHGQRITISDTERIVHELEDKNKVEYYHFIANNTSLNAFLTYGKDSFFDSFRYESIYNDEGFLSVVSIHFADRYDKVLLNAYKNADINKFKTVLSISPLVLSKDRGSAYKSTIAAIKDNYESISIATQNIIENGKQYSDEEIVNFAKVVRTKLNYELINCLPRYYQNIRNDVAQKVRNVQIFNVYDNDKLAYDLIKYALNYTADGLAKSSVEESFNSIKKLHSDRVEEAKYQPQIKKYGELHSALKKVIDDVENKKLLPEEAYTKLRNSVSIQEINDTPDVLWKVRDEIALDFRILSLFSWNNATDIHSALRFIEVALNIKTSELLTKKLEKDKIDLTAIHDKNKELFYCWYCTKNSPSEKLAYNKTIYLVTHRASYYRRRTVNFSYRTVQVPRCKSCSEIHERARNYSTLAIIAAAILGLIIGITTAEEGEAGGPAFVGLLIGAAVGALVGYLIKTGIANSNNIKDQSEVRGFPQIAQALKEGWQLNKPSA